MAISLGNKAIVTNIVPGVYPATIKEIKETESVTLKGGGGSFPAISIEFELEIGVQYCSKNRKYIATDKVGSELRDLIEELIPEVDFEAGVDLNDLIDKKCQVIIIESISRKGNRFSNISSVERSSDLDE